MAGSTTSNTSTTSTKTATASAAPAATGQGTLNINSIPQSNVLLDGRPLGKTPRAGVSVPGGSHTVVFIHPEHGRKQVVVTVIPGRTATAAVRFP
ncbi:MAG: PEGA domain-containing protein [Polyangiaceae bacterium]